MAGPGEEFVLEHRGCEHISLDGVAAHGSSSSSVEGSCTLTPKKLKNGNIRARLIHIDRFGNCVTNLTPEELTREMIAKGARLNVNGKAIKTFRRFFAEQGRSKDTLFAVWGSAGFLEIAAKNQSAAKMLRARCGQTVSVSTRP